MDVNATLYDRQKDIPLRYPKSAIVVGLGGTGSWVAMLLADSGVAQLVLFDPDRLEPSNFNRLPIPQEGNLGRLKVEAMGQYIETLRPSCVVIKEGKRATSFSLATVTGEILFDCTDAQKTQLMLQAWAKEHGVAYVRCGYDGTHLSVSDRVPTWHTTERTGYEITPSWVVPAVVAACLAISKAMYAPETDFSGDLRQLGAK